MSYCNGRHFQAVKPVLFDHGVTRCVDKRQTIADGQRTLEWVLTEDVTRQAGFAAHHVGVLAVAGRHLGIEAVDQQVEHVRFDGTVDYSQVLAVVEGVEHRDFQRGTHGNGGLAWLQVNLYAVGLGERLEARAELVERIAFTGEVNAATQADPLHLVQQMTEARFDGVEHFIEQFEAAVLAVVVEHKAADLIHHPGDLLRVPLTQTAERTGRVGQQVIGAAHLRVDPQTAHGILGGLGKTLKLTDGVEDHLVAVGQHFVDFIIGPGHAVGMGFTGELLLTQLQLVQRAGGGAVHILFHQVEHRPGGKALERQQRLGAGLLTHVGDLLQVDQQLLLVDKVVRRLDHLDAHAKSAGRKPAMPAPVKKWRRIVPTTGPYRKSNGDISSAWRPLVTPANNPRTRTQARRHRQAGCPPRMTEG